jgi:outer membrane protein assembly factor BamB
MSRRTAAATTAGTRTRLGLGLLVALALAASACSTSKPAGPAKASGAWPYPNGDLANTRVAPGSVISSANVKKLTEAWTFKLAGKGATDVEGAGSLAANPVVVNGVVYIQDLEANVYAVRLATGKLLWEYRVNIPEASGPGPDGVAVANGTVYGDSSTAVFALNAATGKPVWVDSHLLNEGQGKFEIQPQVANGRVYISSAYGDGNGGGVVMALDAATGKPLWSFNTVLTPDPAVQAIGAGAGGAWETPLVGTDGTVTFGLGNPYQSLSTAVSHPARQLYTDSEVNLNAATGQLRWYYQALPNDFYDHDLQDSPIAASINGAPVIVGGGKLGFVYAWNAGTGKLIWKTSVGVHNGHDNDGMLALEHKLTSRVPYTFEPGGFGGVLTDMALANGTVYVATVDLPFKETNAQVPSQLPENFGAGEIEALSLATGKVEWDTKVPEMPLGAATVSNDLLFTTLFDGELIALNRDTGAIVYRLNLPTTTNAPIAIAGNAVIIPAGGPQTTSKHTGGKPQLVVYTVP